MKTFGRILALTLSIAMIITSMLTAVVFADEIKFTDVTDGYQYGEAISTLVSEGIINGYTEADGTSTFKPENTITRAEFAKLLTMSAAKGVTFTATTDKFPDVPADHWANTYITAAIGTGAINGYEDGTFRPDNPVSYGEAIKMIVCNMGYSKLVTPTEPWYQGYINIASTIGLTKGASSNGDSAAPRGLVAQLIYNIRNTKKIVQSGVDKNGKPIYKKDTSDDGTEEESGVVTAVFDKGLEGNSTNLNKQQIKIDDTVYYLGDGISVDTLYDYLGRSVDIVYEDGAKKTITSIKLTSQNTTLVIDDNDIGSIDGRELTYYDSNNKEKKIKLASDLYVVYNGEGVPKTDITEKFIKDNIDITCGELTLINNDGSADYDVAYITSYETYYVTNVQTNTDTNTTTVYDTNGTSRSVALKKSDTKVYKVTTAGGKKTAADSLSAITAKSVVSVAKPLSGSGDVEVVVSTAKAANGSVATVVSRKNDYSEVELSDKKTYDISDYCTNLVNADAGKYGFDIDDAGIFYLDYKGRVVYFSKSETSDPYAYLVTMGSTSGGLSGTYEVQVYEQNGSGAVLKNYPLKDSKVRINGTSMSSSEAETYLANNAKAINANKDAEITQNATYSQLIKMRKSTSGGTTYVSDIYTIDKDDLTKGNIIPGEYKGATKADKAPFFGYEKGGKNDKLVYATSGKIFKYNNGNQFAINNSTVVFFIPDNRTDTDEYKRRTYSTFSDGSSYAVEPYDMTGTTAKVVLVYACGKSSDATISNSATCMFVEGKSVVKNTEGDSVIKLTYYNAGDKLDKALTINTTKKASGVLDDINGGDIIRVAKEGNEIVNVQKVFVGGVLYDYKDGDVFTAIPATDYEISHASGSTKDYYRVIQGIVYATDVENNELAVVPCGDASGYDEGNWTTCNISTSTAYYKWNSTSKTYDSDVAESLLPAKDSSAAEASRVVVIIMNNQVKAVYILANE